MKNISEILENVKTVGIGGHIRPDGDCIGSCMALYLYIREYFPDLPVHASTQMTITGHTDSSGDAAANQKLSEERAEAFKTYLVDKGVDASRVTVVGKGSSDPAFPNDTAANRAKNRRIEFRASR